MESSYKAEKRVIERLGDLLTMLDIEEGMVKLSPEIVAIDTLLSSVEADLADEMELKHISYTSNRPDQQPPQLLLDREKISAALSQVLTNAVDYTPENGKITTTLSYIKDGGVEIRISDNGIGIPAAEQSRVFETFYRATNAFAAEPNRSGVGLKIAKRFVEEHGGEIGFTSVEQKGSEFWIRLPRRS